MNGHGRIRTHDVKDSGFEDHRIIQAMLHAHVVGPMRFELTTSVLSAQCTSRIVLRSYVGASEESWTLTIWLEIRDATINTTDARMMHSLGIEPKSDIWQTSMLPLTPRVRMNGSARIWTWVWAFQTPGDNQTTLQTHYGGKARIWTKERLTSSGSSARRCPMLSHLPILVYLARFELAYHRSTADCFSH